MLLAHFLQIPSYAIPTTCFFLFLFFFFLFSFFFFSFFFLGLTDLQMQGFGSLMAVPFAQRYGTYVVLDLLAMLASSQLTGCSA